jgi:hypothetical protein
VVVIAIAGAAIALAVFACWRCARRRSRAAAEKEVETGKGLLPPRDVSTVPSLGPSPGKVSLRLLPV